MGNQSLKIYFNNREILFIIMKACTDVRLKRKTVTTSVTLGAFAVCLLKV